MLRIRPRSSLTVLQTPSTTFPGDLTVNGAFTRTKNLNVHGDLNVRGDVILNRRILLGKGQVILDPKSLELNIKRLNIEHFDMGGMLTKTVNRDTNKLGTAVSSFSTAATASNITNVSTATSTVLTKVTGNIVSKSVTASSAYSDVLTIGATTYRAQAMLIRDASNKEQTVMVYVKGSSQ